MFFIFKATAYKILKIRINRNEKLASIAALFKTLKRWKIVQRVTIFEIINLW